MQVPGCQMVKGKQDFHHFDFVHTGLKISEAFAPKPDESHYFCTLMSSTAASQARQGAATPCHHQDL